jgi:hypothetical protein
VKTYPEGTMDADRFRALALSYGGTITRWPQAERQAAEAFLARCPDAARWLDRERALDGHLDVLVTVEASPRLFRSIAEIPLRHEAVSNARAWWPLPRLRNAIAVVAAAAAVGAAAGVVTPDRANGSDAETSWDDLSGLAFALDLSEELSP